MVKGSMSRGVGSVGMHLLSKAQRKGASLQLLVEPGGDSVQSLVLLVNLSL